jgi:hypothetical protein
VADGGDVQAATRATKSIRISCSRLAVAHVIGIVGLLTLLGTVIYLGYTSIAGTFRASLLWFFVVPFAIALAGRALYRYSWMLPLRKGFRYDYDAREASWIENGERQTFKAHSQDS